MFKDPCIIIFVKHSRIMQMMKQCMIYNVCYLDLLMGLPELILLNVSVSYGKSHAWW